MNISEKDLNMLLEYSMQYLLSSGNSLDSIKDFINNITKLSKSTCNLLIKYIEKGIYNNKMKVDKQEYINFRNDLQQKLKTIK